MSDSVETVNREIFTAGEIVDALYKAMLRREPDIRGFHTQCRCPEATRPAAPCPEFPRIGRIHAVYIPARLPSLALMRLPV